MLLCCMHLAQDNIRWKDRKKPTDQRSFFRSQLRKAGAQKHVNAVPTDTPRDIGSFLN